MSLLSLTREIAIDLGTANTIIITDGKIAVEEPSVVAIRKSDDKMKAVGRKAAAMIDRGEERIYTVRPLKKGVIADYKACEMMIRGLIDLIPQRKTLFKPSIKMVVCVPSGATDAEMRIINDSCVHAGAKELYADVVRNGIYLTGGGALLNGLAERLSKKMTIDFHIADDPLHSVAKGTGIALKCMSKISFLIQGV